MNFRIIIESSKGNYSKVVNGKKHKIKLYNGEILDVATHKKNGFWFVTDLETGFNIIPRSYYGFICYDFTHDISTERNALETAKFCIDEYLKSHNITFSQWRTKRLSEVNKGE